MNLVVKVSDREDKDAFGTDSPETIRLRNTLVKADEEIRAAGLGPVVDSAFADPDSLPTDPSIFDDLE